MFTLLYYISGNKKINPEIPSAPRLSAPPMPVHPCLSHVGIFPKTPDFLL